MPKTDLSGKSPNILSGVDDIIDRYLGVTHIGKSPHYKHRESCIELSKSPLLDLAMLKLIDEVYNRIKSNWENAARPPGSKPNPGSKQNWRFAKQKRVGGGNKKEVAFERAIVNIPTEVWPDAECWANQVPVASGLVGSVVDKRRAIDLVYRRGSDSYEFVELKVDESGGTPLLAAMEILQYGLLYVFSRENTELLSQLNEKSELLQAQNIHLMVMAPAAYYSGYDLGWLEKAINCGLIGFRSERKYSFQIDFEFESLSLAMSRSPAIWDERKKTGAE